MTNEQKRMKKYCAQVERRLALPRKIKVRVMTDFTTTITALRESGMTDEQIFIQLGTPKHAAAELNAQMKEYAYRKSPWRFAGLVLAVLSGLAMAYLAGINLLGGLLVDSQSASVGIIGGADGPTAIFITRTSGIGWDYVILASVLGLGLLIFWRLSHCKPKASA